MSETQALLPIQEKKIHFYGDEITTVLFNNTAFVALRPIAGYLGLSWSSQRQRILADEVLSRHTASLVLMNHQSQQHYKMFCLQLEYLAGWLFGIVPSRVKPELAPKLRLYREECFRILWHLFQSGVTQTLPTHTYATQDTYDWLAGIGQRVRKQCDRATKEICPATLTLEQWLQTLEKFQWKCAYCQNMPGVIIEHFVPLALGGGTTQRNCVPSCYACNYKKGGVHPFLVTTIPREVILTVQAQLVALAETSSLFDYAKGPECL